MGQGGKKLHLKYLVHAWSHLLPPPQEGSLLVLSPVPCFPGPCLTSLLLPLLSDYCPLCSWQGLGHRHGEVQDWQALPHSISRQRITRPSLPGLAVPLMFSGYLGGARTSTTLNPRTKHIPLWRLQPSCGLEQ